MRCYPSVRRRFGAARSVWNRVLQRRTDAYRAEKRLKWIAPRGELTALRRASETAWLAREAFSQVLRDQERAFVNFFAGRARYKRFRRRAARASAHSTLDQRRVQVARGSGQDR